jgi:hypothetical protein
MIFKGEQYIYFNFLQRTVSLSHALQSAWMLIINEK